MRVSLSNSDRSFSVGPGQTVLEAALAAGLNLPHSCRGGNCGACRVRLVAGEVSYPNGRPLGLTEADTARGDVLLCQIRASSDLQIDTFEITTPENALIKRLPCRIERTQRLAHDVMAVYLKLPPAETLRFEAGQYVDILLGDGRRRSFSIASPPHDARPLELHIRLVPGGEFTAPLFDRDLRNALWMLEGPLGHFRYRESPAAMLMVGGGTGLAPLKSLLRHVLENGLARDVSLYWGVRAERDLYAHADLQALARTGSRLTYVPVLSAPSAAWTGRRGWVHEAVLDDFAGLEHCDVYASGPPAMIEAVQRDFVRRGLSPARLSIDSFDYAPDALERQSKMADSSS